MFNQKSISGLFFLIILSMVSKAQVKTHFEVSFKEPQAHYAEVSMTVSGITKKDFIDVKMPVWTPGSYLVREFEKNVESFKASAQNKALKFEKINKNTWRIYNQTASTVAINYRVYAFEISVRTSFIDASHAFLSSTGVFMYPAGMLETPSTVTIKPFAGWDKVSTGLEPVAGKPFTYAASNFDILYDNPIEVGNQDIFEFDAAGVKHEVAMYGGGNYDKERLKVDMAKVVEEATKIYGENPNKHYTFIVHNYAQGGGGLEHLNSTVLGASREQYTNEKGYKGFLNLVAHEYFHLWNVKRMRPIALGPFDYDQENYTTSLWVAEGFTSYYENKLMLRAGLITPAEFALEQANAIGTVMNTPGAKVQSAAASSFDTWIIAYRPNENSKNSAISYYSKGEVIGLLMDIEIAEATNGQKSLDDVMKAMYYQTKQPKKGYTDAEFKAMVEKVAGKNFDDFWAKYVNGVADIEYAKYLSYAGINMVNENEGKATPYFGVTTQQQSDRSVITGVARGSGAWNGGLNVNDELISIDGITPENNIEQMAVIADKKVGDKVKVKVVRDRIEKDLEVTLTQSPIVRFKVAIDDKASAKQLAVRKRWMGV